MRLVRGMPILIPAAFRGPGLREALSRVFLRETQRLTQERFYRGLTFHVVQTAHPRHRHNRLARRARTIYGRRVPVSGQRADDRPLRPIRQTLIPLFTNRYG